MKARTYIVTAALMLTVALFIGCGKQAASNSEPAPAPAPDSTAAEPGPADAQTPAPADDTAQPADQVVVETPAGNEQPAPAAPAPAPKTAVIEINSPEDLAKVLQENDVVLVDFYADWCGPCKMLKPTIKELAGEYSGKAAVAAVNVEKFQSLARQYKISAIPDVRLFSNGEVAKTFIGLRQKGEYAAAIDAQLK